MIRRACSFASARLLAATITLSVLGAHTPKVVFMASRESARTRTSSLGFTRSDAAVSAWYTAESSPVLLVPRVGPTIGAFWTRNISLALELRVPLRRSAAIMVASSRSAALLLARAALLVQCAAGFSLSLSPALSRASVPSAARLGAALPRMEMQVSARG